MSGRPARRRKRTVRNSERPARVTERDRWILEALAKMRFLETAQLARLYFGGSRSAANKRLRTLLDAGLVRAWVRDLAKENVYSLHQPGARLLGAEQTSEESLAAPRGLDRNLEHLLAINWVRISLVVTLPAAGGEIAWWRSGWEIDAGRGVVPDALFSVRWEGGAEPAYALEVDHETRSPYRFVRKGVRYRSLRLTAGSALSAVLVVGLDSRAIERYRSALGHTAVGTAFWFTTLGEVEEKGASTEIWRPVAGEDRYSLRRVHFPPYGKEG